MGHAVEDRICEVCGKDSFPLTSYAIDFDDYGHAVVVKVCNQCVEDLKKARA